MLRRLIGLEKIAASAGGHQPSAELDVLQDRGDYVLQKGRIETEPDVVLPFFAAIVGAILD